MVTDHARAALEGYGPVFEARDRWMNDPTPANKATFDAVREAYSNRFDCSCPTEGPKICTCTYNPAPTRGATTTHSDSGDTDMTKTYAQHLTDCGGDSREAQARFHAETHNSRRPASVASLRSDAVDDAEARMRLDNATAWCTNDEQRKEVQRKLAEQASQAAARSKHLTSVRSDAAEGAALKCNCGNVLMDEDGDTCAECRMKKRNARAWKAPLRGTNQRSAGTIGYHPSDDEVA
jgi:hypothetical protein